MPTFGDMVFQFGGMPVGGNLPVFFNQAYGIKTEYYFVDGSNGSNGNSGKRPDQAFATIATAVTAVNGRINWSNSPWATRDVIVIAPGVYAENLTALPYGATLYGIGDAFDLNGERGVTIKPATGSPVDCTSVINMRIENICFESPDTSVVFQADNFNRNVVLNCVFSGLPGGSPTTTRGLEIVKDMTGNWIRNSVFQVVRNGIYINTDNANSKQASGNIIDYCYIRGCDQKGIYFDVNSVPSYTQINQCVIGDGGTTLALGLDDDTGLVNVSNTMFTATACDPASADGDSKYNNCYLNGSLMS